MSKRRNRLMREIQAMERELQPGRSPQRKARREKISQEDKILAALNTIREACGIGMSEEVYVDEDPNDAEFMKYMKYMDDVDTEAILEALPDEEVPGDDMAEMGYMDDIDADELYEDDLPAEMGYMKKYMDDEEDMDYMDDDMDYMRASEEESGVEDEITQDYLGDVLETEKTPSSVTTDDSITNVAYTARLKKASARLDRIADYLEQHGKTKMAYKIDKIADAIDARIKKEEAK